MRNILEQYVQEFFGEELTAKGFRNIKYRGSRWVRTVDRSVIESIQFVPYFASFEVYYSFHPFFYPLDLPKSRIAYHDRFWTYFNPEVDFFAIAPHEPRYREEPFSSQAAMERSAIYWKKILQTAVFPLLDFIWDIPSCCEAHKLRYSSAGVPDLLNLGFNGRYLLECAYLGKREECERVSERFLLPMLQKWGAECELFIDCQGSEKSGKTTKEPIPVGQLIDDLQGSMTMLRQRMEENSRQTAKLVDKIMPI